MTWSAGYRARTPFVLDTADTTDTTPTSRAPDNVLSVVSVVSVVSSPQREKVDRIDERDFVNCVRTVAPTVSISIDLGVLPAEPCTACGCGVSWRVSTVEPDSSGQWVCQRCKPPPPDIWIDASAFPIGTKICECDVAEKGSQP